MADKPKSPDPASKPITSVSKLAHEIKNPLNAMMGYTNFMIQTPEDKLSVSQMQDWAVILRDATVSLLRTCERVLDDETSGEEHVYTEPVDVEKLANSIVGIFAAEAEKKGIQLSVNIPKNFPILETDPVLLTEILNNLIGNSIKFTKKGGRVQVRGEVDERSDARVLVVQDNGVGIPAHILQAVKRGQTRSLARNDRAMKGWGIGSRVILQNVKKLGAEFELFCPKEGGTVAFVKFPNS